MLTPDAFLDFKCPHCGADVSFPQEQARTVQPCPRCSEAFIVPDDASPTGWKISLPIQTTRLTLRRFGPADWKALLQIAGDEELFQFVEVQPLDEQGVLYWLETERHAVLGTPHSTFYLGVESKEAGQLVGFAGLTFDATAQQADLQLYIGRPWQRQRFGQDAGQALLRFCLDNIRLHRVSAAVDHRNVAALKLFECLGMRREGELVQDRLLKGEWATTVLFAALATDLVKI